MSCRARRCSRAPSLPGLLYVGSRGIWVPNVAHSPWYPTVCEGYEKCLWTSVHLSLVLATTWSTLCICPHSFWQGSTAPWWHSRRNSKWVRLRIVSPYFHPSARSRFPTSPWCGGLLWEERKQSFLDLKIHEQKNTLLADLTIYLPHLRLFYPRRWGFQN